MVEAELCGTSTCNRRTTFAESQRLAGGGGGIKGWGLTVNAKANTAKAVMQAGP